MSLAAERATPEAADGGPSRGRTRIEWPLIVGVLLVGLFLTPSLRAGYRADDTWTSEVRGILAVGGESLPGHLWRTAVTFVESGRPSVFGTSQGLLFSWALDDQPTLYHLVLILLTMVAAWTLYGFVRELGATPVVGLVVLALVAGGIQFRSFHDPVLGYWGTTQILLALTLASLLYFVRALRDDAGGKRDMVVSFLLFLPCPLLYEGAYPLVAAHLAVALCDRRGLAAWRAAAPFLVLGTVFVLLSLYLRTQSVNVVPGYEVGGTLAGAVRTYFAQLVAPLPGSTLIFKAEHANFMALGGAPTAAELVGGAWRGAVVGAIIMHGFWWGVRRGSAFDGGTLRLGRMAIVGAMLWLTSVIAISFAPKYQFELVAGKGHLPTLLQTFGFALVAAAALLALGRIAERRSRAAVLVLALGAAGLLGLGAAVDGYINMRVVALEVPIREARDLLESAAANGVLDPLPAGSSVLLSERDARWNTGHFSQAPDALDALFLDRTGRRYDARIPPADAPLGCPSPDAEIREECAALDTDSAWLRFRPRRDGGTVIVAGVLAPSRMPHRDRAHELRVYATGEAASRPPTLVGADSHGGRWDSGDLQWQSAERGDGWAIYEASLPVHRGPVASTLDDAAGTVDFLAQPPPGAQVRVHGTKRLLP